MKLSIIIPMYNSGAFISTCLDSLCNIGLPHSEYEVIVVDDGSKDNGGEIVRSYEKKYPFIHYILQDNAGCAAARNKGMKHASGDYLSFVDSDDFLFPGTMGYAVDTAERLSLDALCFGRIYGEEDFLKTCSFKCNPSFVTPVIDGPATLCHDVSVYVTSYLFRRAFIQDNNFEFPHIYGSEDICFDRMALVKAQRVSSMPELEVYAYVNREYSIVHKGGQIKYVQYASGTIQTMDFLRALSMDNPSLPDAAHFQLMWRVHFNAVFLALRALRFYPWDYAKDIYRELWAKGYLPMKGKYHMTEKTSELMRVIMNCRPAFHLLRPLARVMSRSRKIG